MAFLKINGIAIPVSVSGAALEGEQFGTNDRTAGLTLVSHRRAVKNAWTFRTSLVNGATFIALRELLLGKVQVWSWDSNIYYSSKGVALTPSNPPGSGGPNVDLVFYVYGGQGLFIPDGEYLSRAAMAVAPWSVAVWVYDGPLGADWRHYVVRSDGAKWVDGVRNDAAATAFFLDTTGGTFKLQAVGYDLHFDDMAFFAFLIPTDWPAQIDAAGAAFGPAPRLTCSGDFIENGGTVTMLGEYEGAEVVPAAVDGAAVVPAYSLRARLREV